MNDKEKDINKNIEELDDLTAKLLLSKKKSLMDGLGEILSTPLKRGIVRSAIPADFPKMIANWSNYYKNGKFWQGLLCVLLIFIAAILFLIFFVLSGN